MFGTDSDLHTEKAGVVEWETGVVESIYSMHDDGHLVQMQPAQFSSEDLLQILLADHPELIAGQAGTRLLLVGREQGVPDADGGADRWSLDHLFVDGSGVPTLVEVKRSSDTRIRREVVGQMLDYAANGVRYWPPGSIRDYFEATAGSQEEAQRILAEFLDGADGDQFWSQVEDNLRSGRLRLVFVADVIPDTLRRIIEFLNEQMDRTEVIGVEVRQYIGGGRTTLVPRIVGRTTAAQRAKPSTGTFDDDLAAADQAVRDADTMLTQWADSNEIQVRRTRRGRQYLTAEGVFLFQFYPMYAALEIPINRLRKAGREREADELRAVFQSLTASPLSQKHLYLPAKDIVAQWTAFTADAVPRLVDAVAPT